MSYGYIYKIEHVDVPIIYIGQSIHPYKRFKEHSFNSKYHSFEIIEECNSQEELDLSEKKWIKYYNFYYAGYNNTTGGTRGYTRRYGRKNSKHPFNCKLRLICELCCIPSILEEDYVFQIASYYVELGIIDPKKEYLLLIKEL